MNQLLRKSALRSLLAYQRDGNKHEPFEVQRQFAFMLSYYSVLPELSPEFIVICSTILGLDPRMSKTHSIGRKSTSA